MVGDSVNRVAKEFFRRIEARREELALPVAVAMEGYNGYARLLDRLVRN